MNANLRTSTKSVIVNCQFQSVQGKYTPGNGITNTDVTQDTSGGEIHTRILYRRLRMTLCQMVFYFCGELFRQ